MKKKKNREKKRTEQEASNDISPVKSEDIQDGGILQRLKNHAHEVPNIDPAVFDSLITPVINYGPLLNDGPESTERGPFGFKLKAGRILTITPHLVRIGLPTGGLSIALSAKYGSVAEAAKVPGRNEILVVSPLEPESGIRLELPIASSTDPEFARLTFLARQRVLEDTDGACIIDWELYLEMAEGFQDAMAAQARLEECIKDGSVGLRDNGIVLDIAPGDLEKLREQYPGFKGLPPGGVMVKNPDLSGNSAAEHSQKSKGAALREIGVPDDLWIKIVDNSPPEPKFANFVAASAAFKGSFGDIVSLDFGYVDPYAIHARQGHEALAQRAGKMVLPRATAWQLREQLNNMFASSKRKGEAEEWGEG